VITLAERTSFRVNVCLRGNMSDTLVPFDESVNVGREISAFSSMLKKWRKLKRCSQLDLAMDADVSQRHVSFLESGRSTPSRDMVLSLAAALNMPLREQNSLLKAAGFASTFQERQLNSADMNAVNHALEMMLTHHDPYPAIVVDRNWNLLNANNAAQSLISLIGKPEKVWKTVDPSGDQNIYRMTFHEQGFRPLISNWGKLSRGLLARLQQEVSADPCNVYLSDLYEECCQTCAGKEGLVDLTADLSVGGSLAPVLPMELTFGSLKLKTFSMISSFGTAQDVTAEELKVETFYPADERTRQFFDQS
jgi:transcriptional regulator with XRE-family HTH domain